MLTQVQLVLRMFFQDKNRAVIFIILISLLAGFLRFYKLADIPPVFNPDEASIAYNAYLLQETGTDEWQKSWPLVLEAFGDQKIGGYTYLVVASFATFGVSEFSVRLPAALAGMGVIFVAGLLVYRLQTTGKTAATHQHKHNTLALSLLTMALISIQPIFIWYGRVAFEATVALLITLILITLLYCYNNFFTSSPRKVQLIFLLGISLLIAISVFLYNVPLVLVPFIFLPVPLWYGLQRWKIWLPVVLIGALTWLVLLIWSQGIAAQKSRITLFGDPTIQAEQNQYYLSFENPIHQKLLGNKYAFYAREVTERFVASLSPVYLVSNANGHPWHTLPGFGYLTWPVYILGWFGLLGSIQKIWESWKKNKDLTRDSKGEILLMYLMFSSLLPAVITVNAPHATRTLLFFVGWTYFSSIGVLTLYNFLKQRLNKHALIKIFLILAHSSLLLWPSVQYAQALFTSATDAPVWKTGLRAGLPQIISQVESTYPTDETIAVHDERGFSYIMFAWYTRMEPTVFFETVRRNPPDTINFKYGSQAGRYIFVQDKASFQEENKYIPLISWNDGWQLYDAKVEEEKIRMQMAASESAEILP